MPYRNKEEMEEEEEDDDDDDDDKEIQNVEFVSLMASLKVCVVMPSYGST
jgi:hypothetical protein